ncbi:hypothetical protein CDL15_Pgr010650 [Punica granatum]|uniref:Reverse transcriptase Ty1/copia-type domain-containing protein n=1 Tax=Punica granatum TaxID=22663 RepID=A0A218VT33_PUNGR|nr:hypothetical protein CDL15_Pgr010650 [Punica granatum]
MFGTECKAVRNKWILKVKRKVDDSIKSHKTRLMVKGYTQKNCRETFSLVV